MTLLITGIRLRHGTHRYYVRVQANQIFFQLRDGEPFPVASLHLCTVKNNVCL